VVVLYPEQHIAHARRSTLATYYGEKYTIEGLFEKVQSELRGMETTIRFGIHCASDEDLQQRLLAHWSRISELHALMAELTSR